MTWVGFHTPLSRQAVRFLRFMAQFCLERELVGAKDWSGIEMQLDDLKTSSRLLADEWDSVLRSLDHHIPEWLEYLAADAAQYGPEAASLRWRNGWLLWQVAYPLHAEKGLHIPSTEELDQLHNLIAAFSRSHFI